MAAEQDSLQLRDLAVGDFHKGYMQLLGQLTVAGDVSEEQFKERFAEISASPDYKIVVVEDTSSGKIVGTASLIVERKFLRGCGKCGHIEDVVVDSSCRGKKLGQRLITALAEAAQALGCYKIILDCAESNVAFYEKCGLARKEVQMVQYFNK